MRFLATPDIRRAPIASTRACSTASNTPRACVETSLARLGEAAGASPAASDYVIGPMDVLAINVWGLADLSGREPDSPEGYWYLARAAHLARGTPAGAQIDQFARRKYREDGGANADWDRYLAAATVPTRPATPATAVTAASLPFEVHAGDASGNTDDVTSERTGDCTTRHP